MVASFHRGRRDKRRQAKPRGIEMKSSQGEQQRGEKCLTLFAASEWREEHGELLHTIRYNPLLLF
jgi:hypothetical protein